MCRDAAGLTPTRRPAALEHSSGQQAPLLRNDVMKYAAKPDGIPEPANSALCNLQEHSLGGQLACTQLYPQASQQTCIEHEILSRR